jgi:hypothetical protein
VSDRQTVKINVFTKEYGEDEFLKADRYSVDLCGTLTVVVGSERISYAPGTWLRVAQQEGKMQ